MKYFSSYINAIHVDLDALFCPSLVHTFSAKLKYSAPELYNVYL